MKSLLLITISILLVACHHQNNSKQQEDFFSNENAQLISTLPDAPRWILDTDGLFNQSEIDSINILCEQIFKETGHIPMIHTVSDYGSYTSLNEYTQAIDAAWADKSQKYFIILVDAKHEEVRFVHGEITESAISPDFTDMVMRKDMFPQFKTQRYGSGIINTLKSYLTALRKI